MFLAVFRHFKFRGKRLSNQIVGFGLRLKPLVVELTARSHGGWHVSALGSFAPFAIAAIDAVLGGYVIGSSSQ